jgi:hypothetical protein
MTAFGKILVFVNLVFSLVTAALIVMAYTTRINWKDAYGQEKAAEAAATANVATVKANADDEVKRRDGMFQALKTEKDKADADVKKLREDLAKADERYKSLESSQGGTQEVAKVQAEELARRKAEVETLKKQLDDRDKKVASIDQQMARLRDESVQYRIQWEQSKERIAILQAQVEQLARENERQRQQLGNAATTGVTQVASPTGGGTGAPPARIEDLKGTVQRVDGDLATITPGSDAGVAVGTELNVFRLQPKAEYLGKLTILNVTPTQAVGRLSGPKARQVKANDEVAASLR